MNTLIGIGIGIVISVAFTSATPQEGLAIAWEVVDFALDIIGKLAESDVLSTPTPTPTPGG